MFPLSFNDLRRLIRFISIDEFVARVIYRWIELWYDLSGTTRSSRLYQHARQCDPTFLHARPFVQRSNAFAFFRCDPKLRHLFSSYSASLRFLSYEACLLHSFHVIYETREREKKKKKRKSGMKFSLSSVIEYILFAKLLIFSRTMIWKNINIFFSRANKWQFEINQKIFDEDCLNEWSINDLLNNPIHY